MRRLHLLLIVPVLALVACTETTVETQTTLASEQTTTAAADDAAASGPAETTTTGAETTTSTPETTVTTSGRPVAPDFTLDLGDGGTYTLSDGEKPVYMVFWAEW